MNKVCIVGFLILGLWLACTPPTPAAQFIGGGLAWCVTLPEHGGSVADGTVVRLIECRGQANQQWTMNDGQISGFDGKCLDIQGGAAVDGAQIVAVSCSGAPSQKWGLTNGQFIALGGKCLNVSSIGAPRAPLIITACSNAPTQQWSVT
jgi:Ricin-type beta-trefoil lectin domain